MKEDWEKSHPRFGSGGSGQRRRRRGGGEQGRQAALEPFGAEHGRRRRECRQTSRRRAAAQRVRARNHLEKQCPPATKSPIQAPKNKENAW